ncbi:MAG TPA: N-acylneuraminate cytidylyltransferase [Spirochaetota bacterium]|nr:N-acylneuraminate cytidylyltransferase [Spirochaetota bacterium]
MIKYIAFIPVRGGSKSIPLKNIKAFCGKPLVYWTVRAAAECRQIETVYVSTDSEEIRVCVNGFGFPNVHVVARAAETATDGASTESAMLDFSRGNEFVNMVLVQATSPLLTASDLVAGIDAYERHGYDSLLSVVRQKRFIWNEGARSALPQNYDPKKRPRRQEWEGYFVENGAFYITSRERLMETGCRISGRIGLHEMPEYTYYEIDEPADWTIMEQLKRRYQESGGASSGMDFGRIRLFISDVDGVLTDGGMYYTSDGDQMKKFNTRDGKGIELLRKAGIKTMILSGENTEIIKSRAYKLQVDYVLTGIDDKKKCLDDFFREHDEFNYGNIAYIGDDLNDLDCIGLAYFSAVPSDGAAAVRERAHYLCTLKGGEGCVREVADLILEGRVNDR